MREQTAIVVNDRKEFNVGEDGRLLCNVIPGPIRKGPIAQSVASLTADLGITS